MQQSRPQVLIDGSAFESPGQLGIWRLFFEVISRSARQVDYTLLLDKKPCRPLPSGIKVVRYRRGPEVVSRRHILHRSRSLLSCRYWSRRFPHHLWHPTFYTLDPRGKFSAANARLTTVYDMIAEEFYWMGDFALQQEMKQRCLNSTDHVISISQSTRTSLLKHYPNLAGRVEVIMLAGQHFRPPTASDGAELKSPEAPYCLFVGGRRFYKNFAFLIDCLANPHWPMDLQLAVVGAPFDDAEMAYIKAAEVQSRVIHKGVLDDQHLNQEYCQAECFVFPSLGEGFGLPILEAQAAGTVPVLADTPVFHEVAREGAVFFQPCDQQSCIDAVQFARNLKRQSMFSEKAKENLSRYSWDATTSQVIDFYRRSWDASLSAESK